MASPAVAPSAAAVIDDATRDSFTFDAERWPQLTEVIRVRQTFFTHLRAHDGLLSFEARNFLRSSFREPRHAMDAAPLWFAPALLAWAHHTGRSALLLPILTSLSAKASAEPLLRDLLQFTPHLPFIHAIVELQPLMQRRLHARPLMQSYLSALMQSRQIPLDTFQWLVARAKDAQVFAPRHGHTPLTLLVSVHAMLFRVNMRLCCFQC